MKCTWHIHAYHAGFRSITATAECEKQQFQICWVQFSLDSAECSLTADWPLPVVAKKKTLPAAIPMQHFSSSGQQTVKSKLGR